MWGFIFAAFAVVGILAILYIVFGFRRFAFIKKLSEKHGAFKSLCVVFPAIIIAILLLIFGMVNAVIIVIHWLVIWILCDIAAVIVRKISSKNSSEQKYKPYIAGVVAVVITVTYMTYGWISAHNVVETDYIVETDKLAPEDSFRILQISDSHTGAIFDGEGFMEYAREMQKTNPDIVLFTGDLVDDNSSYEDMVLSCKAIASIKSKYGTYYVYGNHDKRYFGNGSYTAEQLREELIKNDIRIIEDSHIKICDDKIAIIGRQDASVKDRKPAIVLKNYITDDMFTVVLDHQPNDYFHEEAMNFDVVLSGHTHGGQLLPLGQISLLFGINDMIYGMEKHKNTTFIVNSGIADWEIPFKTGCISEYVVIDIVGTKR